MSFPNPDVLGPKEHNKEQVNYRQKESCNTCAHFNGRVYCSKVNGHISPDAICNLWTLNEEPVGLTNKEVITKEYEKSQGGK